ncbi:hypothetical protein SAMN04488505_1011319 [Chitinophaga rupis]|uniref:SnoaL-like domain-containing protein n=1 Tax=Chitinophaga rupis TaxID=573321 RepID=A0A1H7LRM5_9BACT|nr:hypothetical protein [Chitinophaga rupis]SEL01519.1 hypothetical protein SAMN04488505_1011319 [Chitinophaga rupis]
MQQMQQTIEQFFKDYENRFAEGLAGKADVAATTAVFADCFIEASPRGVICGKNDDAFRASIPKGYDFYKSIGTSRMNIEHLTVTALDDLHYMVKVRWQSYYLKDERELLIEFDVTYFLQQQQEQLKIFAYITGDEQQLLKERGVIS